MSAWGALSGLGKGLTDYSAVLGKQADREWQLRLENLRHTREVALENLRKSNNLAVGQANADYTYGKQSIAVDPNTGIEISREEFNKLPPEKRSPLVGMEKFKADQDINRISAEQEARIDAAIESHKAISKLDETQRATAAIAFRNAYPEDDVLADIQAYGIRYGVDVSGIMKSFATETDPPSAEELEYVGSSLLANKENQKLLEKNPEAFLEKAYATAIKNKNKKLSSLSPDPGQDVIDTIEKAGEVYTSGKIDGRTLYSMADTQEEKDYALGLIEKKEGADRVRELQGPIKKPKQKKSILESALENANRPEEDRPGSGAWFKKGWAQDREKLNSREKSYISNQWITPDRGGPKTRNEVLQLINNDRNQYEILAARYKSEFGESPTSTQETWENFIQWVIKQ